MKKTKILGICSVLSILLTACGGAEAPSSTSERPGFSYEDPSTSIEEDFVVSIDYSGNTILKELFDKTTDFNKAENIAILEHLDANPLVPTKGVVSITDLVKYDLNEDGILDNDLGNLEVSQEYSFTRNNETHSKSGTLKYVSKTVENVNGVPTVKSKNIENGEYSLTIDTKKYDINETYDFKDESLNKKNTYFLNESNLHKHMQVINLENFKEKSTKTITKWVNDEDPKVTLTGEKTETEVIIKASRIIEVENVKNTETYVVKFDISGFVKSANWTNLYEVAKEIPGTYDFISEKHSVNYTFAL